MPRRLTGLHPLVGPLALALVLSAAPAAAAAAGATPTPPPAAHDATRPRIMQQAGGAVSSANVGALRPRAAVAPLKPRAASAPAAGGAAALTREVFGFALAGSLGSPSAGYTTWDLSLLSTIAFFGLHVNAGDGGLVQGDTGWNVWHSSIASGLVNAAHASGVRVVLTVIYQDLGGGMCTALDSGANTANQVAGQLMGADGVNIDYEGSNQSCPGGVSLRAKLVQFVQALRARGLGYLSIDTYAGAAEGSGGFFDIPSLAGSVDSFFVMDYDLELSNGPCPACIGPTSPLAGAPAYAWNVTRSADDYAPWASRTILGFPYYGVKGCVGGPNPPPNAPVVSGFAADTYANVAGYPSDPNITSWNEQRDGVDPAGQEPWAAFYSRYASCWREEYWDDAVSLGRKYDLVNRYGMRGAGIFTLDYGGGSPDLWGALRSHFSLTPAAPANVAACPGDGFAYVAWSPPASAAPVTGYRVGASPGGAGVMVAGSAAGATVPGLANGQAYTFTVRATNAYGTGPASTPSSPVRPGPPPGSWPGRLHPLTPDRILDTRIGLGAPRSKLAPGGRLDVPVLGRGGIPSTGVSAVVLNVTIADATDSSYLGLSASGACALGFSNLNFGPGDQAANLDLVAVGAGGDVSIFNLRGYVDVIADVSGWIGGAGDTGPDGHYQPVTPRRILDTRLGTQGITRLGPAQTVTVGVLGRGGLPGSGVSAVVLNLTSTGSTQGSFLSAWPAGRPQPPTSNLNFAAGQVRANRVVVPVGANGGIELYNSQGSTDAVIDVAGWFTDGTGTLPGGLFNAAVPVRALDTRIGLGAPAARVGPGQWLAVQVSGQPGLPSGGIEAVAINLTVTGPGQPGYLEVNESGTYTDTSDLNFAANQTVPNLVVTPVDGGGRIHLFNAGGATDVIVDVLGWY